MDITINEFQLLCKQIYTNRGYTDDLPTLGLGLAEEIGEVCKAINQRNPLYIKSGGREEHDLEHELVDVLVYLFGIANSVGIDIERAVFVKFSEE